ncbi:cGMP-specific 3',5'-cyclic phosphodiesterase-like [Haliotis rufescens]|uniref:cGMP-specific 3',5'-cyclic phosphodiesterase-like n=1 Tax=Haliotis rufescens TaxID=6454 RepID=UPI001EB081AA|nr:cGMP-specific 3',5'-cyclic phosphodiesterase-like [Haliotis rufescens]
MSVTEKNVEEWLNSNPSFLPKYIANAPRDVVNSIEVLKKKDDSAKLSSVAKNVMASKILKKYLNGDPPVNKVASNIIAASKLDEMNENDVFMELVRDIASELDVNVLCHKILRNVSLLTKSDRGSLFLARGTVDHKYLVSKLFDVTQTSTLEESLHTEETEIKVPFGRGIAGHVALTKETVNIKEAYDDPRFNQAIDKKTGYRTHSILCMPIVNHDGEVIGVAQIINKIYGSHDFVAKDIEIFKKYLTFCGIGIMNAQLFEMSIKEYQRNQLLLNLARGVFEEQTRLQQLVQKIMVDAQQLLKCERCSVYLLSDFSAQITFESSDEHEVADERTYASADDVRFSTVFVLSEKGNGNIEIPSAGDIAMAQNTKVSKLVVFEKMSINIPDLEFESRFGNAHFVDSSGFKSKSILCVPIFNSKMEIIGVTQLINKSNGMGFNENDENIIEAFSIFTGLGIHNCIMYENVCKLMAKQKVALEVLSYHATASEEETQKLVKADLPSAEEWGLYTYIFDDSEMDELDTCRAVIKIFCEVGAVEKLKVPYDVLCRWTLSVKKNYRPVTYHNWRHAFNVFQSMFTIMYTGKLGKTFDDIEIFAILAACLCHDLDHRGTNNAFQVKAESPLAMLYSTSVMEHHHFDHCIMILNSPGNNIFKSLSGDNYRKALSVLEHAILSTDLALYFKKRADFKGHLEKGVKDFSTPELKDLLTAMMMTACDVAAICKPWEIQFRTAQMVASEFFEQGDMEKDVLGENPIPMMDREKQDQLPKMQVGFIDFICLPIYKLFSDFDPALAPLYDGCANNRKHWQELVDGEAAKGEGNADVKTATDEKKDTVKQQNATGTTKTTNQVGGGKDTKSKTGKKGPSESFRNRLSKRLKLPKSKICVIM